jgi:hypothetical protein
MVALVGAGAVQAAGPETRVMAVGEAPEQLGGWQAVALEGASCGRGAPYSYFLNPSSDPEGGLFFLLNGGGACLKDGPAPAGAGGVARQLYCMDYSQFTDPTMNELVMGLLASGVRFFNRNNAANPFRNDTYVWVPYCTGDIHTGQMTQPYDYDLDPVGRFEVTHRGRLNFLAVVEDMHRRYPQDVPVVLSGLSAGGFGVIFNFPDVVTRWPHTVLLPDAGIAPPSDTSLMAREGARVADRWGVRSLLPPYCHSDDCVASSMRLLAAHAEHYDGRNGPWRPFGFLQGQQDGTLAEYLEISRCSYQLGLRRGLGDIRSTNLRGFLPATSQHVFVNSPDVEAGGVTMFEWFRRVAGARGEADLPADAIDPWLNCNSAFLPRTILSLGAGDAP